FSSDLVSFTVKPNFRALGERYGAQTKLVAAAVGAADPAAVARTLREGGTVSLPVEGVGTVELGPDDVIVTEQPRAGWAVETGAIETGAGETVALDLTITDELRRAGLARDVIRLVQEARKSTGLSITDRIDLWWSTEDDEVAAALRAHGDAIKEEVLAVTFTEGGAPDLPVHRDDDLSLAFQLRIAAS